MNKRRSIIFTHYINKSLLLGLISFLFWCNQPELIAQTQPPQSVARDSAIVKDSAYIPIPTIPLLGSVDRTLTYENILRDTSLPFTDYQYLGDLLSTFQGVYVRDLGSPGQMNGLTFNNLDSRSIAILSDGVLLNEPLTGSYDMNLYPTEQIERVEMVPATRSFLYGMNSTGGAFNVVSKNYHAIKPISRIRFVQSAYEYTLFDGLISQDIRRDLNVTLGLQHPTYGGRFLNSEYDAWDGRAKIRYNVSRNINIILSDIYSQTVLGLNGGKDTSNPESYLYERYSTLRNEDSYEKITRHDIQFTLGATLLPESTDVTTLTFFHSTSLREYRDENSPLSTNTIFLQQDHRSQWYGARLAQHYSIFFHSIDVSGEYQSRGLIASSPVGQKLKTYSSLWAKDELKLIPDLTLTGYIRYDNNLDPALKKSYGADVTYFPISWLNIFGGISHSYRDLTLQEEYRNDTISPAFGSKINPETHNLIEIGFGIHNEELQLSINYFNRKIEDPILFSPPVSYDPFPNIQYRNGSRQNIQGVSGKAEMKVGVLFAEGKLQYFRSDVDGKRQSLIPEWTASGGIYFRDTLFGSHLKLKVGLRGRIISAHDGVEYNPQAQAFVPSTFWNVDAAGIGDFVLLAHLGDADIHLVMENIFGRDYILVPFYPMPDRAVRFGLNWEFLN